MNNVRSWGSKDKPSKFSKHRETILRENQVRNERARVTCKNTVNKS